MLSNGKISFGVKKVEKSKVDREKIIKVEDDEGEKEEIRKKRIKRDEDYVIPLINKNKWRTDDAKDKLTEQAAQELIDESKSFIEMKNGVEEKNDNKLDFTVPMLERNRVPDGFEDGNKLDVSIRPDQPDEANYEEIPIEKFGMAMLRGMGFNKDEGIGKTFKQNVQVYQTKLRPKGLGLGAAASMKQNKNQQETITKNDFVFVIGGSHKHQFGVVTYVNGDLGRCDVILEPTNEKEKEEASISENLLKKITKEEFNKLKKSSSTKKETTTSSSDNGGKKRVSTSNGHGTEHKKKRRRKEETWLQANLKVRVIDEKMKKYYREKVVIEDVYNQYGDCLCRTMDGELLNDLNQDQLETVIPRTSSNHDSYVIITKDRKYKGKLGKIMKKDREESRVYLQLIEDRDVLLDFDFDDVCEYVGDVEQLDLF